MLVRRYRGRYGCTQSNQPGRDVSAGTRHAGGAGLLGLADGRCASRQIGAGHRRTAVGCHHLGAVHGSQVGNAAHGSALPAAETRPLRGSRHRFSRRRAADAGRRVCGGGDG